jgi:fluoride exporter
LSPTAPPSSPRLPPVRAVLAVAAGGAVGGTARTYLSLVFPVEVGAFPWTTYLENVAGAFLLGFVLAVSVSRGRLAGSSELRPFLATGVLGSFTTFSTYTLETLQLVAAGEQVLSVAYALGSILVGVGAGSAGLVAGRVLEARR